MWQLCKAHPQKLFKHVFTSSNGAVNIFKVKSASSLQLLVYEASATSVCGLELLVYAALSYEALSF